MTETCAVCTAFAENHCEQCKKPVCYSHAMVIAPGKDGGLFVTLNFDKIKHSVLIRLADLTRRFDALIASNELDKKYNDYNPTAPQYKVYECTEYESNELAKHPDEAPRPIKGVPDSQYKKFAITVFDQMVWFDDVLLKTYDKSKRAKCPRSRIYCENCSTQPKVTA